jgi:hypothetical protein
MKVEVACLLITLVAACVVIHEQRMQKLEKDVDWINGIVTREIANGVMSKDSYNG